MKQKHIVIISYLFPPINQIGSRRAYYLAKYLSKAGFKTTVLTSGLPQKYSIWEADCSSFQIIRLKRIRVSLFPKRFINGFFGKAFRIVDFFLSPIESEHRLDFKPHSIKNPDIILATGGPWQSFEYGVELKKNNPNSKLIFDYRDSWSVIDNEVYIHSLNNLGGGIIGSLKKKWILKKEMNLLYHASAITSITSRVLNNASKIAQNKTPNKVIFNGYDKDDINSSKSIERPENEFWISFTGIIRIEQEYEMFLDAIENIFDRNKQLIDVIKFNFIGSKNTSAEIIINRFKNHKYRENIILTSYIDKEDVKAIQLKSHILLHFSYTNKKGILSGKIFEYLAMNKPILLVSKNNDVIEELILETKTGIICRTSTDIEKAILTISKEWSETGTINYKPKHSEKIKYTFEKQTKELIKFFNEI